MKMEAIKPEVVQSILDKLKNKQVFLHLETTNGAYAAHRDENVMNVGAYIRNTEITFNHAKITGDGPYRVGLKLATGWVYAEGLTDFELDKVDRLLLAGHNADGKLAVALEIGEKPF